MKNEKNVTFRHNYIALLRLDDGRDVGKAYEFALVLVIKRYLITSSWKSHCKHYFKVNGSPDKNQQKIVAFLNVR